MLWVDEDFITQADLITLDSEIAEIAETENIVISDIIRRAKEKCQGTLSAFMSFSGLSPTDLTLRNLNFPIGTPDLRYNYAGFAQLVVNGESETNWGALKHWVAAKTLAEFYRAATNKNSDRYSDRHEGILEEIKQQLWPNFKRRGLPIVFNPLVAPGAIMERAGTFGANNVDLVAGAGTSTATFYFAITWVGDRYLTASQKFNSESYRSARVSKLMVNGQVARVSIAGLIPPDGQQPEFTKSNCRYTPGRAVGWNVWAGITEGALYRQNAAAIPIATTSFTLPGDPLLTGEKADLGQFEDIVLEIKTQLVRGN